jgi:O-antigen ligase
LVLPLLVVRVTDLPTWGGRYALLAVEAAVGLPMLLALVPTPARRTALAALSFVAVASLSTLLSDNPAMSFWGNEYWGTGLLFVFAMAGMWAIGRSAGADGAQTIERALVVGTLANAAVALLQVFADLTRFGAIGFGSQSTGLLGQPVLLGAFLLGGLWLVAARAVAGQAWMLAALVLVSAAIEVSGERVPLLLCLIVGLVVSRGLHVRTRAIVEACIVVGLVSGAVLGTVATTRSTATSRLVGAVGQNPRIENYVGAIDAIADRPVLGWGPSRYVAATSPTRTLELGRAYPDKYFVDAHDWPLHWAVTTGLVGVAALGGWLFLAARAARGPLLGFAACVGVVQLIQPQDVTVTALAVLALGAAGARSVPRPVLSRSIRGVFLALGVAVSAVVLVGMWHAYRGAGGDTSERIRAADALPHWPGRAQYAATASLALEHASLDERIAASERWAAEAVARDDRDPGTVAGGGYIQLIAGDLDGAQRTFQRCLALDPFSPRALSGLGLVEFQRGHSAEAVGWFERALAVSPDDAVALEFLGQARQGSG